MNLIHKTQALARLSNTVHSEMRAKWRSVHYCAMARMGCTKPIEADAAWHHARLGDFPQGRSPKVDDKNSGIVAACVAHAAYANEARSLERGAVAHVTPQQKYQSAIREAGGANKEWLRECMPLSAADQRACRQEAKASYDADMAAAKQILR